MGEPPLLERARAYERDALEALFERCFERTYAMCVALTGDAGAAEALTRKAALRGLAVLPGFGGDPAQFEALVLRAAASAAARRRESGSGLRRGLAQLTASEYELLALRLFGELPTERLASLLGARPGALRAQLLEALRALAGDGERGGLPWGHDLSRFDRALDAVMRGGDPRREAAGVQEPDDVLARLQTVALLRRLRSGSLSREVAGRLRGEVLAAAAEMRALWIQRHQGGPLLLGAKRSAPSRRRGYLGLAVLAGLAAVAGVALAAVAAFADPDSTAYPFKRLGESALVALDPDPVGRAELEVSLAQTRQREAEDMAASGHGAQAVQAVRDRLQLLRAAAHELRSVQTRDARWRAARDHLLTAAGAPLDEVERNLDALHQGEAAAQVRSLDESWAQERLQLARDLGEALPSPAPTLPASA